MHRQIYKTNTVTTLIEIGIYCIDRNNYEDFIFATLQTKNC